jgi:hypothetical protein
VEPAGAPAAAQGAGRRWYIQRLPSGVTRGTQPGEPLHCLAWHWRTPPPHGAAAAADDRVALRVHWHSAVRCPRPWPPPFPSHALPQPVSADATHSQQPPTPRNSFQAPSAPPRAQKGSSSAIARVHETASPETVLRQALHTAAARPTSDAYSLEKTRHSSSGGRARAGAAGSWFRGAPDGAVPRLQSAEGVPGGLLGALCAAAFAWLPAGSPAWVGMGKAQGRPVTSRSRDTGSVPFW